MTAPTPTNLKLLRGNPGKRPINKDEPQYIVKVPPPPKFFTDAQKKLYRKLGRLLKASRVITEADGEALINYVQYHTEYHFAVERLQAEGYLVQTPNGMDMQSPYVAIKNNAWKAMRTIMTDFGMTPASRTRIQAILDGEKSKADPWGNL